MSKVGKKPLDIPKNTEVKIGGNLISVKGANGEFKREIPEFLNIEVKDDKLTVSLKKEFKDNGGRKIKEYSATWGLTRALIKNMLKGASEAFNKSLEFEGVGYKAAVKGADLELNLGYSHPITVKAPKGITFKVEKNVITVMGSDKELVGHVAAEVRSHREPEPYQGSGIKYKGEYIKRKAGKKAAAGA